MSVHRSNSSFLSFKSITNAVASTSQAQPHLYCFPYAGGAGSIYAPWAKALSPQISVIGVEYPGHGSRFKDGLRDSVHALADEVVESLRTEKPTGAVAFYGHSLGAVIAFEAARRLHQAGSEAAPIHLFTGAARAPHLPPSVPAISHLSKMEFLEAVQARYGGVPAALFEEPELLEIVVPVLRADFYAYEKYRSVGPSALPCPITAFSGASDPVVRKAAVAEWSLATGARFRMEEMPGDHFFLNTCKTAMLNVIRQVLDRHLAPDLNDMASRVSAIV